MTDRTDRELLEAAANAAGIELGDWNDGTEPYSSGVGFIRPDNSIWNPLLFGSDAMELSVKQRISIGHSYASVTAALAMENCHDVAVESIWHEDERPAATRRAIVRRAAASLAAAQGETG